MEAKEQINAALKKLLEIEKKRGFLYYDDIVKSVGVIQLKDVYLPSYILSRYCVEHTTFGPKWSWTYKLNSEATLQADPQDIFADIVGHDDVKNILKEFINSEGNANILLVGDYGTGKTMFIRDIEEHFPSVYVEGGNATAVGILQKVRNKILELRTTRIFLLIDELDKMVNPSKDGSDRYSEQEKLANLIDTAAKLTKSKFDTSKNGDMSFDLELKGFKVIATANRMYNISPLLQSRFGKPIIFGQYTKDELFKIGKVMLMVRYHMSEDLATAVANYVVQEEKEVNMREVDKLGNIIHSKDDLDRYRRITSQRGGMNL